MTTPATFHHITLTVTDLPRSVEWYERVLGMTKVADREGPTWKRALMRSEGGLVIAQLPARTRKPGCASVGG